MSKALFAASVKEDVDVGDIIDFIDEESEGDYEAVAWTRGKNHRLIVLSELALKSRVMSEFPEIVIRPIGQIIDGVADNRNRWVYPLDMNKGVEDARRMSTMLWEDLAELAKQKPKKSQPLAASTPDEAGDDVHHDALLDDATHQDQGIDAPETAEAAVESTDISDVSTPPAPDDLEEHRRRKRLNVERNEAQRKVLEAFGLTGDEKDEDGQPIKLFTLGGKLPETESSGSGEDLS